MKKINNKGSVLIITIIISSVLFSIGTTLSAIWVKELTRQAYADRSQVAFNISNSALECVLYNDFQRNTFNTFIDSFRISSVDCGLGYKVRTLGDLNNEYNPSEQYFSLTTNEKIEPTYTFVIIESDEDDGLVEFGSVPCADIALKRRCLGVVSGGECSQDVITDSIEVKGYHACTSGPKSLVRRFKIYY